MPSSLTQEPIDSNPDHNAPSASRYDRRVIAIAGGTGIAAVGAWRIGVAQTSDPATPESTTDGTPTIEDDESSDPTDTSCFAEHLTRIDDELALVQADLDAAGSDIDTSIIDPVLADVTTQREAAQAALDGGDPEAAMRFAVAASGELRAGRTLIAAQLSYPGLPSEGPRAARTLAHAYEHIGTVSEVTGSSGTDITFQVTTAQELYTAAYALYESGAFAQSSATAEAGSMIAEAGLVLAGEGGGGFGSRGGFGLSGDDRRRGMPDADGEGDRDDTSASATPAADDAVEVAPVTPPAPDFGS